jgi:hypothetical protein
MAMISPVTETKQISIPIRKNGETNANFNKRMRSYERTTTKISTVPLFGIKARIDKKPVDENGNTVYHHYIMSDKSPRDKLKFLKSWFDQFLENKNLINYNIFTPNNGNKSAFDLFVEQQTQPNSENLSNNSNYKAINSFNHEISRKISFPVLHNWLQTIVPIDDTMNPIQKYLINKERWNQTSDYYVNLIKEWRKFRDWVISNKNISNRIPNYLRQLEL